MRTCDLTIAAEDDLRDIRSHTTRTWGLDQADRYFDRIEACCEAVGKGRAPSRSFEDLPGAVWIHRGEHHYIVWLAGHRPLVIAIRHERMDVVRRLGDRF